MKVTATKITLLQPKQYHTHTIGGTVEVDSNDESDIRDIANREGITARSFTELAQKVAQFLAKQQYNDMLAEYKALPASDFQLAK